MTAPRAAAPGMYLRHFGLRTAPFGITPDPAFFYTGNTRGALLDALLYAVTQGEGIIKVSGEVGSGKTMLCRMLAEQLPPHIDVLYLLNPSLGPGDVLHAIASELGLNLEGDSQRDEAVLRAVHAELITRHAAGRQVVLLAEEAQAMPIDTLEAVRLLTNLETARHKLLQIVLFGQPELDRTLALPQLRQLKERITHSFTVPRLPQDLLGDYLACRLLAAGRATPLAFDAGALRLLARSSQGIVRRVNILADKALLAAYVDHAADEAQDAIAGPAQRITARHLRLAIADSPFRSMPWHAGRLLAGVLSLLLLVSAGALLWQWLAPSTSPATLPLAHNPLLDNSIATSLTWLARQAPQRLVLHVASFPAHDRAGAEAFLQAARQATGLQQLHVFRLRPLDTSSPPQLTIVYGSYADRASAEAIGTLLSGTSPDTSPDTAPGTSPDTAPQKIVLSDIASIRREIMLTDQLTH